MDRLIVMTIALVHCMPAFADWSRQIGGLRSDAGRAVAIHDDHVYVAGTYHEQFTLAGETLIHEGVNVVDDVYLAQYDRFGTALWARRFGGPSIDSIKGLAADARGVVALYGFYGVVEGFESRGFSDAVVIAYSSSGAYRWVLHLGGLGYELPGGIGIAGDGTVIVAVMLTGSIMTNAGTLASTGNYDIALFRVDPVSGLVLSQRRYGAASGENVYAFDIVGSRVLLGGYCDGQADFGDGVANCSRDAVIAEYDLALSPTWIRRIAGSATESVKAVAVSAVGDVYAAVSSFGATEPLVTGCAGLPSPHGGRDVVLVAYDSDRTCRWQRRLAGVGDDDIESLALDGASLYAAGSLSAPGSFGGETFTPGDFGAVLAEYRATDGVHIRSRMYDSTTAVADKALSVDAADGWVAATGSFGGTLDFGHGPLTPQGGYADAFLLSLGEPTGGLTPTLATTLAATATRTHTRTVMPTPTASPSPTRTLLPPTATVSPTLVPIATPTRSACDRLRDAVEEVCP
jgi:hypothetical protein